MNKSINDLQSELDNLQQKINISEFDYVAERQKLNEEITKKSEEINDIVHEKESAVKEAFEKLNSLEQELKDKDIEVSTLQAQVDELIEYKKSSGDLKTELIAEKRAVSDQLKIESEEKEKALENLKQKLDYIRDLEDKLKYMELDKNFEIVELHEDSQKLIDEKNEEVDALQKLITEKDEFLEKQRLENVTLSKHVIELTQSIELKTAEIIDLNVKLDKVASDLQVQKAEYENCLRESNVQETILKDKLQNVVESKDEMVANLKSMIAEKDEQVISLNVNITKLSEENSRLKDELEETKAELEISNGELFGLKEEHEALVESNEDNLLLKNQELRKLHDEIKDVTRRKEALEIENDRLTKELKTKTEVCLVNIYLFVSYHFFYYLNGFCL